MDVPAAAEVKAAAERLAMSRLEDEFRRVLSARALDHEVEALAGLRSIPNSGDRIRNSDAGDDEDSSLSSSYEEEADLFPSDAIGDLHAMASRMAVAGYGGECVQAYAAVRKTAVESSLRRLGVEKLSLNIQCLGWDALEVKISRWTCGARAAVRGVFASERRLCFLIFHDGFPLSNSNTAADAAFAEAVKGAAQQLLGFAEAVSIGRPCPEKLFKIVDMHDTLADLLPDISVIFAASKATDSIYMQAAKARSSLADAASLSELITSGPSNCSRIVTVVGEATPAFPDVLDVPDPDSHFPFAAHLAGIIVALEHNLESKAFLYKDVALSHLFLMNNVCYIVHKITDSSEFRGLIGDEYLKQLTTKFRQASIRYEQTGWLKILNYLRHDGDDLRVSSRGEARFKRRGQSTCQKSFECRWPSVPVTQRPQRSLFLASPLSYGFSTGVSKLVLRERFKGFNTAFGEAHKVQSGWYVPDARLRDELRISILKKLLLAYQPFLGRFRHHIEKGKHPNFYIKYSIEDLEEALSGFFEGASPS
ncbi:hypothetical protein EJB05_43941, partial [Eragrostis curvula]